MAHHMTTLPRADQNYVVISPPLGDVREKITSRSLVEGQPPRSFPSIVVPRMITVEVINNWLGSPDISALDMAVFAALGSGDHGGRSCVFDKMSTRLALDRFVKNLGLGGLRAASHPRSPVVFSRMAEHYNKLREYVMVAEDIFEWEEKLLDKNTEWLGVEVDMRSRQAESARLAMVRDGMSVDEFRAALLEVKEVMDTMNETGIPGELASALLDKDWQQGCLKYITPR